MNYTDEDRAAFLTALDISDCDITDWEVEFLESLLDRSGFTANQRGVIDGMIEKYGDEVKF